MEELSIENYQKFKDLSVFPSEQVIKLFLSIPKAKTLQYLRGFEKGDLENLLKNINWTKGFYRKDIGYKVIS